jgi:hypothetical protein
MPSRSLEGKERQRSGRGVRCFSLAETPTRYLQACSSGLNPPGLPQFSHTRRPAVRHYCRIPS